MVRSAPKIMRPAFDPTAPLFASGELAKVSGLSRAMVDVWVSEGRLKPTRREQSQRRTRGRGKGKGRPMFSAVAIFTVRLTLELSAQLRIGLSEWVALGVDAEEAKIPPEAANITELAEYIADGNWFFAVARGVENNKPFKIYSYATRAKSKWLFDTHIGEELKEPCFGLDAPFLFIPMWRTFSEVYVECKKLLGISEQIKMDEKA
jgi:hypothetical protein